MKLTSAILTGFYLGIEQPNLTNEEVLKLADEIIERDKQQKESSPFDTLGGINAANQKSSA